MANTCCQVLDPRCSKLRRARPAASQGALPASREVGRRPWWPENVKSETGPSMLEPAEASHHISVAAACSTAEAVDQVTVGRILTLARLRRSEERITTAGIPSLVPPKRRPAVRCSRYRDRASVLESLRLEPCLLPDATLNTTPGIEPPSRLCSAGESVPSPHRCQWVRWPVLPWALFPFKIPYASLLSLSGKAKLLSQHRPRTFVRQHRPTASCGVCRVRVAASHPSSGHPGPRSASKLSVGRAPSESVRRAGFVNLALAEAAASPHGPSWGL